jgi:hypothetical protein
VIAVGYFREAGADGRPESVGRQNRRFLDFCEAEGYEVATTFAEEAKTSAFSRLIDYLRAAGEGHRRRHAA